MTTVTATPASPSDTGSGLSARRSLLILLVTAVATAALAPWPLPGIRPSKSPASDRGLGRPPPR